MKHSEKATYCGAKRRRVDATCKRPAGWGTDHPGSGRCKFHGGNNPGRPGMAGNKIALKTGEKEVIEYTNLTPEELKLYHAVDWNNRKARLINEIALLTIRENRMLARIEAIKSQDLILIEQTEFVGMERGEQSQNITKRKENPLILIQSIEEALTRVQSQKINAIERLHRMDSDAQGDDGTLQDFVAGIDRLIRDSKP